MTDSLCEKKVKVNLGERSYDVLIGHSMLNEAGARIKSIISAERAFIVSNPIVLKLYGDKFCHNLKSAGFDLTVLEVPDGERHKSLETARKLYDRLIEKNATRFDVVIALGGGVIGDLSGFVAATYMRGMPFVQVPTTLLAQIDSSVGGKVAVNHPKAKNLIGCFYQPKLVLADVDVLKTLPERELKAGLAEAIKCGFLDSDDFISFLEEYVEEILAIKEDALIELVKRCCEFKARVVETDEKDLGRRAILNYGHTIGHAIEAVTDYKKYLHGEAVAMGMVCAARIAHKLGLTEEDLVNRHRYILRRAGLPISAPPFDPEDLKKHLLLDKKKRGGKFTFVLLRGIGEPSIESVSYDIIAESLKLCR
ncbi:MAG TPA: 3-dehydroquinate synthase [Actinobacteria bacterium]|nr:3-dehydroquinate synthase [Actinomycetota bacterium]